MSQVANVVFEQWTHAQVDEEEPDIVGVHNEPASAEALDAFEQRHDVKLPAAFRALYALSDGTGVMDAHEHIFWPLAAMSSQLKTYDVEDPAARWIGFADFRLQTAVYYLRVDRSDGGDSVWIDAYASKEKLPDRMQSIAESFEQFLERYADDPLFWK